VSACDGLCPCCGCTRPLADGVMVPHSKLGITACEGEGRPPAGSASRAAQAASLYSDDREGIPLAIFSWGWAGWDYSQIADRWLEYAALRKAGDDDAAAAVLSVLLYGPDHRRAAA
jgi:hypothetical protein